MYILHSSVCCVQFTLYSVQFTVYSVQCRANNVTCVVSSVPWTILSALCKVFSVHKQCKVYSEQFSREIRSIDFRANKTQTQGAAMVQEMCVELHCIVLHWIVLHCIVLHCIVLHCIVVHCIVLHCIVVHCIVLFYIVLQSHETQHTRMKYKYVINKIFISKNLILGWPSPPFLKCLIVRFF